MPRKYIPKLGARSYRNYTEDDLKKALLEIAEGEISIREASKKYHISYGTLFYRRNCGLPEPAASLPVPGHPTALTLEEEKMICDAFAVCADWGFPLSTFDLRIFAKSYLETEGRHMAVFKDGMPGEDWANGMIKRHSDILTKRLSQNINVNKARVGRSDVEEYFECLTKTLDGVPPSNIFNYDETAIVDCSKKKKQLHRRGVKYPVRVENFSKSSTTVLICGSASGILLPPYILYKSEHLYAQWRNGCQDRNLFCSGSCCAAGAHFNKTKSGWLDSETFSTWFFELFLPHALTLEGKVVLIGDNLATHFTPAVIRECQDRNISFVTLPPNSTHLCQPLDVAFFRSLKSAWSKVLSDWKAKNINVKGIPKSIFASLLLEGIQYMNKGDEAIVKKNLESGFRATGIYPLDSLQVLKRLPGGSETTGSEAAVSNKLIEFLKDKRFPRSNEAINRKRTRLQVKPGQSVTAESIGIGTVKEKNADGSDTSPPAKKAKKNKKKSAKKSPTPPVPVEEENEFVVDEPEELITPVNENQDDLSVPGPSNVQSTGTNATSNPQGDENIEVGVGDFIVAKWEDSDYVCHVQKFHAFKRTLRVAFLRESQGRKDTFVYPHIPDTLDIKIQTVERILPAPIEKRGKYYFGRNVL